MAAADPVTAARPSDLGRRTLVGVVLVAVALAALWLGGLALWLLAAAAALVGVAEWGGLVGADRVRLGMAVVILGVALAFAAPSLWGADRATVALLLIASLLFALAPRAPAMAAGTAYLGLGAIGLLFLRALPHGFAVALWTLVLVWATDIGAYFAGRAIGGPKLAPAISPNKTWAGLAGGVVAAATVGAALALSAGLGHAYLWAAAPLALLAQGGDLWESWMKRRRGLKDSGGLLPGHGGVLDRLDGALPVVILIAALNANGTM